MENIFIFLVLVILILIGYILILRMFKYAVLLMCANDKSALYNLINKSCPYKANLVNRDIPLSILLNRKKNYSKIVNSNAFKRIDYYISKYTKYNHDYEYMSKIEKVIESKLCEWLDISDKNLLLEKYPTKLYYLKTAIIIRFFFAYIAYKNIKPKSLDNWKEELIKYNDFNDDLLMKRIYFSICNEEIPKYKLLIIENEEPSFLEINDYLNNVSEIDLKSYVSYFFYWNRNPMFGQQK